MESVLHNLDELQRMADDLAAATGPLDADRYEADTDRFLGLILEFLNKTHPENHDFLTAKLNEARSNLFILIKAAGNGDPSRLHASVKSGLTNIYRSLRNPATHKTSAEAAYAYADE